MPYSKVTKKGQMTIPVRYRRKYKLTEGATVSFKETNEGLLLKPMPDIVDSAGALASYADIKDVLSDIVRTRKEDFR